MLAVSRANREIVQSVLGCLTHLTNSDSEACKVKSEPSHMMRMIVVLADELAPAHRDSSDVRPFEKNLGKGPIFSSL